MTKEEKKDKKDSMDLLKIPSKVRGSFMNYSNRWGRFNLQGDFKWYEWSPLEAHQKATMTMPEMWEKYQNR